MNHAHDRADELDHLVKLYIKQFDATITGIEVERALWNQTRDERYARNAATALSKLELRYHVGSWHAELTTAPSVVEAWREARDAFEAYRRASANLADAVDHEAFTTLFAKAHLFGDVFVKHVRSTYDRETLAERTITDINGQRWTLDEAIRSPR